MSAELPGTSHHKQPESVSGRFYPLIDSRCTHRDHGSNPHVYRAVGDCSNCRSGPYLLLVTSGHRMPTGKQCPKCGCYDVSARRLAEDDELPDTAAAVVAGSGTPGDST